MTPTFYIYNSPDGWRLACTRQPLPPDAHTFGRTVNPHTVALPDAATALVTYDWMLDAGWEYDQRWLKGNTFATLLAAQV